MSTLFIGFVSFVSYATGVVAVQRRDSKGRRGAVHPLEVLLGSAAVSCGVFLRKPHSSLKYLAICTFWMLFVGAVIGSAMLLSKKHAAAGTREYDEGSGDTANLGLWRRWLNFSRAVVDYEFRLLLLACYLLIIGPFAVVFRLGRRKSAREGRESSWLPRSDDFSLDAAGRPF